VDALYAEQYEMHTGQKFVVPAAGYDSAILMHPEAFEYCPAGDGVEIRHLGDFFDHPGPNADVRFSMACLSGGSYTCAPDRAQVAWTTAPGLRIEGTAYPEHTYVYSPRDEKAELTSSDRRAPQRLGQVAGGFVGGRHRRHPARQAGGDLLDEAAVAVRVGERDP
jgi:hypothetical protein